MLQPLQLVQDPTSSFSCHQTTTAPRCVQSLKRSTSRSPQVRYSLSGWTRMIHLEFRRVQCQQSHVSSSMSRPPVQTPFNLKVQAQELPWGHVSDSLLQTRHDHLSRREHCSGMCKGRQSRHHHQHYLTMTDSHNNSNNTNSNPAPAAATASRATTLEVCDSAFLSPGDLHHGLLPHATRRRIS